MGVPVEEMVSRRHRGHASSEEKFAHFLGLGLAGADVTAAQIRKSLHIVAAAAVAVLTQGREVSTPQHHIPPIDVCLLTQQKLDLPVPRRSALVISDR